MALAIVVLALVWETPPARPAAEGGPRRELELVVVDAENGQPLPGVLVKATLGIGPHLTRPPDGVTDERGRRPIDLSGEAWFQVAIAARKEGYVPVQLFWHGDQVRAGLPGSYRLELERGVTIGGAVQDERGRPIAGVQVYPSLYGKGTRSGPEQLWLDGDYHVETDAQGRWRCTMMPARLGKDDGLFFRLRHRDYASEPADHYSRRLPFDQLRASSGVFVMHDGVTVSGRVIDERGRPVAGARVVLGASAYSPGPEVVGSRTDAEGRFRLEHAPVGEWGLLVEAGGHGPVLKRILIEHAKAGSSGRVLEVDGGRVVKTTDLGPGRAPLEVRLASFQSVQDWLREREEDAEREANAWKNWLMSGLIAASVSGAIVSWLTAWRRRSRRPAQRPG